MFVCCLCSYEDHSDEKKEVPVKDAKKEKWFSQTFIRIMTCITKSNSFLFLFVPYPVCHNFSVTLWWLCQLSTFLALMLLKEVGCISCFQRCDHMLIFYCFVEFISGMAFLICACLVRSFTAEDIWITHNTGAVLLPSC